MPRASSSSEQSDFETACDDFVTTLQAEAWFPILGGAINVHRLNVASDESGADDPATCGDGSAGSGASPATYFDSSFCNSGIRRCLAGNETIVRDELDAALPEWHVAAVLVNTSQRGGCASNDVFWTALSSDWKDVVLHELGHAAFGLADEYQVWAGCDIDTDRDNAPLGEPPEPNVTANTSAATLKWRNLLSPGMPVPTMLNPDCTECDERPNAVSDDHAIGLYEGAKYYHCGRFRPAYTCRMRDSGQTFCRVCLEAVAAELGTFITPTPALEVEPASLDFGDVGEGMTMYRALTVRNRQSGFPGQLRVTLTALASEFTYPPETELAFTLPAPILEAATERLVFVAFTAPTSGGPLFADSLDVASVDDPGSSPIAVTLQGRAIEPPPVDSVLVIDRSGSMSEPTGLTGETKRDHAIAAANLYVSLLKEVDRIGIVRYNDQSVAPGDVLLTMRVAGVEGSGAGRLAAWSVLTPANLDPNGFTSIGSGIIRGSALLDSAVADARALVVLTDGLQNTDPDIADAQAVVAGKSPAQRVFAVGLGLNQLEDTLDEIATVTNGVAQITGDLVDAKEFLLQKLYVQILADIGDEAFIRDPVSTLFPQQQRATPVFIGETDIAADFVVVLRPNFLFPKYLDVWLEAPDGTIVRPADAGTVNMRFVQQNTHLYFRCQFPVVPGRIGTHAGRWRVWVRNLTGRVQTSAAVVAGAGGAPLVYSVMAKARSDLRLGGRLRQSSYAPGSSMFVTLEPTLYGLPVAVSEPVRVDVLRPDGAPRSLVLTRTVDGTYEGTYVDTPLIGPYLFTAEVSARTPLGHAVTRFRQLTGIIFKPGPRSGRWQWRPQRRPRRRGRRPVRREVLRGDPRPVAAARGCARAVLPGTVRVGTRTELIEGRLRPVPRSIPDSRRHSSGGGVGT